MARRWRVFTASNSTTFPSTPRTVARPKRRNCAFRSELPCVIPLIIGNNPDGEALAGFYGIEFHHIPVNAADRGAAEEAQLRLLAASGIDLVVLARYMQILPPAFVEQYPSRIINVHHSFLPAFVGAHPYHAAFHQIGRASCREGVFVSV